MMQKKYRRGLDSALDCIGVNAYPCAFPPFLPSLPQLHAVYARNPAARLCADLRGLLLPPSQSARPDGSFRTEPLRGVARAARIAVRHDGPFDLASARSAGLHRDVLDCLRG